MTQDPKLNGSGLTRVIDRIIADPDESFTITRDGRDVAVLISPERWETLQGGAACWSCGHVRSACECGPGDG